VSENIRLTRCFFSRNTVIVARELLGMRLVHMENGQRIAGQITETEAYRGEEDSACHARAGCTPRTSVMYGPPGHAYVYFNYGIHWLLNFVTESENYPAAVLIRGIRPSEGVDIIARRRGGQPRNQWTNGPAKLCHALGVDKKLNGVDFCSPGSPLFVEMGVVIPDANVTKSARVGLSNVPEPWLSIPWRFRCVDVSSMDLM
jgi:DNA-3-methyladenine glycosylase